MFKHFGQNGADGYASEVIFSVTFFCCSSQNLCLYREQLSNDYQTTKPQNTMIYTCGTTEDRKSKGLVQTVQQDFADGRVANGLAQSRG